MINKSLLSLGRVIETLARGKHVPYRDSKLTMLLQSAFGGGSQTSVIVAASTHKTDVEETLSSLRFGCRVAKIQSRNEMTAEVRAQGLKERMRQKLLDLRGICRQLDLESRSGSSTGTGGSSESQSASSCFREVEDELLRSGTGLRLVSSDARSQRLTRRLFVRELLPSLLCALGQAVMRDPVIAPDGYCYERNAIRELVRLHEDSPVTGKRFPLGKLVENRALRELVRLHEADLPPAGQRLPTVSRLGINQVYHILSFFDVASSSPVFPVSLDFLALASSPCLWQKRLFIF